MVRPEFEMWENREPGGYEKRQYIRMDMEYSFFNLISLTVSPGYMKRAKSEAETIVKSDRWNVGLKLFSRERYGRGALSYGGGVQFHSRISDPAIEGENLDFYLVRGYAGLAKQTGKFEMGMTLQFQSETNRNLQERGREEFKRHYQAEMYMSWSAAPAMRLHLETAYRIPYNKKIDTDARFWNVYPGISYLFSDRHSAGISLLLPLRKDGYADRGVRLSYTFFIK
jgi:hypothetical protein